VKTPKLSLVVRALLLGSFVMAGVATTPLAFAGTGGKACMQVGPCWTCSCDATCACVCTQCC
jgi:hypothetical protein